MSIAGPVLAIVAKMIGAGGGSGKADQRELGRAEQQNADSKADMAIVRRSTDAARAVEQEPTDENDPHDRARR